MLLVMFWMVWERIVNSDLVGDGSRWEMSWSRSIRIAEGLARCCGLSNRPRISSCVSL